ncbi:MAG TPA: tryptophan synthase subunit alpha [Verrucomicrobiae bacterium]|nr:tryptophan synthase subunit alpha [Verrucomicrobiae bacterium]
MNRIDAKFRALRGAGQKGFIAYICAGDPNLKATANLARGFERAGVDVLELGVPFSDPLADGVVNQLAAERALRSGTTLPGVLKTVAALRRDGCGVPIVLYVYFNLLHHYGLKRFVRSAADAGVDGVLALDLPPEEGEAYESLMKRAELHPIYLIAPTTPTARVRQIVKHASGFIYYVSREGVTGMQKAVTLAPLAAHVASIRKFSELPVAIGFGISNPAQARAAARAADAVVVGSAIVNQIAAYGDHQPLVEKVSRFVGAMVTAVKSV